MHKDESPGVTVAGCDTGKNCIDAAIVAVMRKLLHAIYGMLKHDTAFDGEKFYPPTPQTA